MLTSFILTALAGALTLCRAQNSSAGLDFGPIDFASYNNYVYRDNITACQIVISDSSSPYAPARFVTAFPNGNTGAAVYFIPRNTTANSNSTLGVTLDPTSVKSYLASIDNQTGIQGDVSVSGDLEFGVTLIGGVRTVRDYVESGGTVFHTIFNYTLGYHDNSTVVLVRHWINGTTVQYFSWQATSNGVFNVTPNANVTLPPNITLTRPDQATNATLRFTSSYNFTTTTPSTPSVPLEGLGKESLFLTSNTTNGTSALSDVLAAIQNNGSAIADQTAFLAYSTKFLAGGWRFLTYFGRDTMLALRLLLPVISQTSAEAILGAVLERTNDTGTLCHEETIGDYASFVNMGNNQSELGNTPFYSYVMLDTDFLLLPVLADYFTAYPQGTNRSTDFLATQSTLKNGTFRELLLKNVDHVMNLSIAFANDPKKENLVPIRDPTVGDWRDSNTGLGYGIYPFDVECALIPSALRAIATLTEAGILPSNYSNASTYASVWETNASPFFQVSISASAAQSSLTNYVQAANLSESLLYGAGSLNNTQTVSTNGSYGWSDAGQIIGGDSSGSSGNSSNSNSTFYALSLKADGSPVEVLHSDLGFVLLYANNVSQSIMQAVIEALQPYPRGLLTNVGMIVANAAYDTNTTNIETFNNLQYHGTVSWSWQQGLMAAGLSRQLGLCGLSNTAQLETVVPGDKPAWCNDTTLLTSLTQAQIRLWDSIAGSAPALYTEVLSPVFSTANGTFSIGDLGAISPTGTEGDAIQLWSYGFLAQVDPRTGKPVAQGFP
ncbi:hypothetical protein BCR39DRAFT_520445 [Naematelia encephala]|uniref:Glycogen debranching enzyme n=1 Tax=Naematelia encephala TaxID=71784 RepID=A0A1Y2BFK1_9TREE|nr:hypothetical protein BCR39DRAFT_520445 [Naematelia encephala]